MTWRAAALLASIFLGVHWGYVLCTAARAARARGQLTPYWSAILVPPAVAATLLDVAFQLTFGWVMFLEAPTRGGLFFSHRVQHHVDSGSGWRLRLALFYKRNLNVFDPTHIKERGR